MQVVHNFSFLSNSSNTMPFLQYVVQSLTETCPAPPPELETDYMLNEESVPLQCCKKIVPVACRVGDNIYKVTNIPYVCMHIFLNSVLQFLFT